MLLLPNGCSCSKLSVHPKNWKRQEASTSITWYIHYRFYDPTVAKPKLQIVKGMNHISELLGRREATQELLDQELHMLKNRAYNPITGCISDESNETGALDNIDYVIDPSTPMIRAFYEAVRLMTCEPETKRDAKNIVTHIEKAAVQLRLDRKPVSEIRRRHIKMLLDWCAINKPRWTDNTFNVYRSNLMMIYKQLIELECVELDPVSSIRKKKRIRKIRRELTREERLIINDHLKEFHPNLWRYMHIFFHSGSRSKELFRLKGGNVDLAKQRFKCLIKKGGQQREVRRPIKDIALRYWIDVIVTGNCGPDDFVFSRNLKPGPKPIQANRITRMWNKYVKGPKAEGGLEIDVDFYSLKYSNLDETAKALNIQEAARMAAHTSTVITMNYAQGENERQQERLRKVSNPFV
ncbi:MAG TPA: tyrosine-type recombinase/integrase [Chitinophagaceae bacterium]|nr:tyrosine-type recombinase/integrase [Chitinophagaceae bacterium]